MKKLKLEELNRKTLEQFKSTEKLKVCVVLDNVRSMLNVGSIFRTCDAFLVEKIWLCGITASPPHRDINKTALGATESVDWKYSNSVSEVLSNLKQNGYITVGVEQTNESQRFVDFKPDPGRKYALVFGNEVEGISDEAIKMLDLALEITQAGTKHSLNVSVAAGIVIYKFFEEMNIDN